jgi:triacylglycerol lipase
MASPFAGVKGAAWLGIDSVRDLHPSSAVLRSIVLHPYAAAIPHLSIVAGADSLVDAPRAHALPGGDVVVVEQRGHNTLPFDEEVARLVERRVLAQRAAPARG